MKSLFKGIGQRRDDSNIDDDFMINDRRSRETLLMNDYLSSANGGGGTGDYESSYNGSNNRRSNSRDESDDNDGITMIQRLKIKYGFSARMVMNVLGNILAVVTVLSFLIIVPWIAAHAMIYDKARPDFAAFYSALAFVLTTVAMSTCLIYNHLTNWYMPDVQKYVVRILWMVPIYSVQSWLSLRFHDGRIYIDLLRDLYEAYVIQSFLYYLMELLGGEDTLVRILEDKDQHYGDHPGIPKWLLPPWQMGFQFMIGCKHGVLQYVVLKSLATVATAILEPIGLFGEGEFDLTKGYVYISFVINLSQMWALYCLVKFYHATSENLCKPVNWHPLGKFLCIKGVVFFTWWQGVLIAVLKDKGLISDIGDWAKEDVANGLQDYLICVEMFCFAIAHAFTFTHKEYLPNRSSSNDGGQGGNAYGDEGTDEDDIGPPIIRTLNTPMGFRDALWSSTVPNETFDDIKRTISSGVSDSAFNQSAEMGMLRNVSMQHAESI
eukprot:CAMPEP_0203677598 /NCGR_PEP_ID=MMETSP0090-20130426/28751_1 /ASSEMBLY_ACC=CAM_ASM_001088 /TAXON_ID=426623 /ORGANISM="Chaetoceros affinis, Strain CCMP159" /LENGTH=492 /DNA_ID=CAMNT_0050544531 /DNA_START=65 /DNA_END=1543 /DNA_ORIENTATION=+